MYIVQCTVYTVHCTMYSRHFVLHEFRSTVYLIPYCFESWEYLYLDVTYFTYINIQYFFLPFTIGENVRRHG